MKTFKLREWSPYIAIAIFAGGLAASAYATRDRVAPAALQSAYARNQARQAMAREVASVAARVAAMRTRRLLEARTAEETKPAHTQNPRLVARR